MTWGLGVGLAGAILLLLGAASRQAIPDSLEAKRFVLRDHDGRIRAQIGFTEGDEVAMNIHGKDGKDRIVLSAKADGSSSVELCDNAGRRRFFAGVNADGSAGSVVFDTNGKIRQKSVQTPDGVSALDLLDKFEKSRFTVSVREGGTGVVIRDAQGTERLLLAADDNGPSRFELRPRDGQMRGGNVPTRIQNEPKIVDPTSKARLETAQKALALLHRQMKAGKEDDTLALYFAWHARYGNSLVASANTNEERIRAINSLLDDAKRIQQSTIGLFERGEKTELDVLDATFLVLKAEAELAKAKAD